MAGIDVLTSVWRLADLLQKRTDAELAAHGLTRARVEVLTLVVMADADRGRKLNTQESTTQAELARRIGVTPRNITGLMDGLERDGLLVRQPHPRDRRAVVVVPTDAGRAFVEARVDEAAQLATQLFGELPDDVRATVIGVLDAATERLTA